MSEPTFAELQDAMIKAREEYGDLSAEYQNEFESRLEDARMMIRQELRQLNVMREAAYRKFTDARAACAKVPSC